MDCPNCHQPVASLLTPCPHCGHRCRTLAALEAISIELRETREDCARLAARLENAGQRLAAVRSQWLEEHGAAVVPPPVPSPQAVPAGAAATGPKGPPPLPAGARVHAPVSELAAEPDRDAEVRFGQKWLLIVGLVITVLGVGYFLKYSFDQNWIGPAGRVGLGFLVGIGFLGAGEAFRRKNLETFGLYLIGGGIATLYFASFAGFSIYHLFGQTPAFALMTLITVLACALAMFNDARWVAVLGLIGGFLTPVVLSSREDHQISLMTYLMILNAGILAIGFFKQWRLLNVLGFIFTWLLFAGWFARHYETPKFWPTTVYLNLFFLTYALVPFAYYFLRERGGNIQGFGITMPNAFIAFGFSYVTIRDYASLPAVGIVTLLYAAIFLALANHLARKRPGNTAAFVFLVAQAVLFLVITVPVVFSKHWITVFWAAQACVLLWASVRLDSRFLRAGSVLLYALSLGKLFFYDYDQVFDLRVPGFYYRGGFFAELAGRWITLAAVLGCLGAAARLVRGSRGLLLSDSEGAFPRCIFGMVLFLVLNFEVSAYFHDAAPQARFAAISVLWTIFSIVLMAMGFAGRRPALRKTSLALFAATVFKVFFVDMAHVSTPFRIISFTVLGVVLIGASFLYYRYKNRILPGEEPKEPMC